MNNAYIYIICIVDFFYQTMIDIERFCLVNVMNVFKFVLQNIILLDIQTATYTSMCIY